MPTCACASAGDRHTVTLRLEPFDDLRLLFRQHFRFDRLNAEFARHGLGRRPAVAGEHDDADLLFVQETYRFGRRLFDLIGDADQTGGPPIYRDKHHRLPFAP
jgi:hypothetical protein